MGSLGNFIQKYQVLIGLAVFAVIIVLLGGLMSTAPQDEGVPEGTFTVIAKWKIYGYDLLDEGAALSSGTLAIYDPDNPGVPLESGLTLSSGAWTTGKEYTSGTKLFLKYTDSTYFDYGIPVTIPKWTSEYDSQVTLDLPVRLEVIKMADVAQGSSNTDIDILKNGAVVWDDNSSATNAFNRTADGDYPKMGIMVTNEDTETAYVDPRGYFDYAADVEEQRDRKAYLIIEFALVSGSAINDVNDYLRFQTWPSGMIKKKMGTSMVLFYPLNSMDAGYLYDIDTDSNPIDQKDGNAIIFELTFDFSGAISTALDGDDIDIQVSLDTGFPILWFETHEQLTSVPGDDPLGEMSTAWTNDCSIGW